MTSYKIKHHTEECVCENCGSPLYVGDTVKTYSDYDEPFCSDGCVEEGSQFLVYQD